MTVPSSSQVNSNRQEQRYKFTVGMSCSGCSGAVERALKRVDGIKDFQVSLKDQSVVVDPTTASFETVEGAIKKTGKQIKSGEVVKVEAQPVPAPAAPAVVA